MKLEMKMVYLHPCPHPYDAKPQKLQYEDDVDPIDEKDFSEKARALWQGDDPESETASKRFFATTTHFRARGKRGFCIPSFWIVPEDDEDLSGYSVSFGVPDAEENDLHPMDRLPRSDRLPRGQGFIDTPMVTYGKDGDIEYESGAISGSLGVVHPGLTYIYLLDENKQQVGEPRKLLVYPSSVTMPQLESMTEEIISIRRELVQVDAEERNHARTVMSGRSKRYDEISDFNQMIGEVDHCLKQIVPQLRKIDAQPRCHLKERAQSVPVRAIKRIDQHILRQYVENPGREAYTVPDAERSTDIYEHRLFRNKLEKLARYFHERHDQYVKNLADEQENLQMLMKRDAEDHGVVLTPAPNRSAKKAEAWAEAWKQYQLGLQKECFQKLEENPVDEFNRETDATYAFRGWEPTFRAYQDVELSYFPVRIHNVIKLNNGDILFQLLPIPVKKKKDVAMEPQMLDASYYGVHTKVVCCEVRVASYDVLLAVIRLVNQRQNTDWDTEAHIFFHGRIKFVGKDNDQKMYVYDIERLELDGQEQPLTCTGIDARAEIRRIYVERVVKMNDEAAWIRYENAKQLGWRWKSLDTIDEKKYKETKRMLQFCCNLPLFRHVCLQDEDWHMTQIFTNDQRYRTVFQGLRNLDNIYDFTFEADVHNLVHTKVDEIYEYWIFCRIIKKLVIDQGWQEEKRLADQTDTLTIINEFFEKPPGRNRRAKGENLPCVHLTHPIPHHFTLHMEIYYDTPLKKSLAEEIKQGAAPECKGKKDASELCPDYLFRVWKVDNEAATGNAPQEQEKEQARQKAETEKLFFLDAKYRDYHEMGIHRWKQKDLQEVCADKYIDRPMKFLHVENIGLSFIIHSDDTSGKTNPNRYLGQYVTYDAVHDDHCLLLNAQHPETLMDGRCHKINENHPEIPIGSFYLVPNVPGDAGTNQSDINLETFFKIMLEYSMKCWHVCWHCGSTNVAVKTLYTRGGYAKYHLTCNDCHAFWVKNHDECGTPIIKHMFNYFVEWDRNTWHLRCPICHPNMTMEEEKEQHGMRGWNS